jgi:hypothetical protein
VKKKEVGKWNKTNGNTAKETVAEGQKKREHKTKKKDRKIS